MLKAAVRVARPPTARRRCAGVAVLVLAAMPGVVPAGGEQRRPDAAGWQLEVAYRRSLISLEAVQAPLAEVLLEIGRKAGIETRISGQLTEPVTRTLRDVTVKEAVLRVAGPASVVMVHAPPRTPDQQPAIAQLWVYGSPGGGVLRSVVAVASPKVPAPAPVPPAARERARDIAGGDDASRLHAVRTLAAERDEAARHVLGILLTEDPNPAVRREAADALASSGDEQVVPLLEAGLGDQDAEVRARVIDAVAGFASERGVLDLGQVLFGDPDPDLRRAAVEHLARDPGEPARAFLEAAMRDADPAVRASARRALGLDQSAEPRRP